MPCARSRSLICGTAAAASSRSTVTRTISEPARASAATWATVAATSPVSVLVIDWTTMGAPPPTITPPTSTATELRRWEGPASVMRSIRPLSSVLCRLFTAMRADPADLDHRRLGREAGRAGRGFKCRSDFGRGGLSDCAATLADQEHDRIVGDVRAYAGKISVAA